MPERDSRLTVSADGSAVTGAATQSPDKAKGKDKDSQQLTVMQLLAPARGSMIIAAICSFVAALLLVPTTALLVMTARIWLGEADAPSWQPGPVVWGLVLILGLFVSQAFYFSGVGCSHKAEATLRLDLRKQIIDKLGRASLGRVNNTAPTTLIN